MSEYRFIIVTIVAIVAFSVGTWVGAVLQRRHHTRPLSFPPTWPGPCA